MKKTLVIIVSVLALTLSFCKKSKVAETPAELSPVTIDNYASLNDFYAKNGVALQTFTVNAADGGSFISSKGTTVNIPANAFSPASGIITIEFKDIYKKSEMLLSNMTTQYYSGLPLISAGEFFIKALGNNVATDISLGKKIEVLQPLGIKQQADTAMRPLVAINDSAKRINALWMPNPNFQLLSNSSGYVFSLFKFSSPISNGTWCNSDNPSFFTGYTQTKLTIHPNKSDYINDVFLVFKNINSMVHVYATSTGDYVYNYAPQGLECTLVVLAVKDGKIYSSFTPIYIGAKQTVNFDVTETTTADFKTALNALD